MITKNWHSEAIATVVWAMDTYLFSARSLIVLIPKALSRSAASVSDTPVFHDHPGIEPTKQLELFDMSQFKLGYVSRRRPNRKHPTGNATQLVMEGIV